MNEIAVVKEKKPTFKSGGVAKPLVPETLDEVWRLGDLMVKSGLAPKEMRSAEACSVAIITGLEVGLNPMTALQRIAVINGCLLYTSPSPRDRG